MNKKIVSNRNVLYISSMLELQSSSIEYSILRLYKNRGRINCFTD